MKTFFWYGEFTPHAFQRSLRLTEKQTNQGSIGGHIQYRADVTDCNQTGIQKKIKIQKSWEEFYVT